MKVLVEARSTLCKGRLNLYAEGRAVKIFNDEDS
jgi:hypothetical protein